MLRPQLPQGSQMRIALVAQCHWGYDPAASRLAVCLSNRLMILMFLADISYDWQLALSIAIHLDLFLLIMARTWH